MIDSTFWKNYFGVYDVLNLVIPYQELLQTLCDYLDIQDGDKILDAGSGTGNLMIKIQERGGMPMGVDFSREGISRHKQKDPTANVLICDLTNGLPFENNYFDRVVSNNVLYSITPQERDKIVKEFLRVLRPGGKIVISNMKEDWKPMKIYISHLHGDFKKNGLSRLLLKVIKMCLPTVQMFYYNSKIKKEGIESYRFMRSNEQKGLLKKNGFTEISDDIIVYAGQAIMNTAIKP